MKEKSTNDVTRRRQCKMLVDFLEKLPFFEQVLVYTVESSSTVLVRARS
jgi:hypothetical protein